jgi:hypothetical protein
MLVTFVLSMPEGLSLGHTYGPRAARSSHTLSPFGVHESYHMNIQAYPICCANLPLLLCSLKARR